MGGTGRRITVPGQPGQKARLTGGVAQGAEHLICKHEASVPPIIMIIIIMMIITIRGSISEK
jgi:hypothetical protein